MKGGFVQTPLVAVALDAENQIVTLAWAIVESENESSWRWSLPTWRKQLSILTSGLRHSSRIVTRDYKPQTTNYGMQCVPSVPSILQPASRLSSESSRDANSMPLPVTHARTEE